MFKFEIYLKDGYQILIQYFNVNQLSIYQSIDKIFV